MNKTMIDLLKDNLEYKGYIFSSKSDFSVEVEFPKCKVIMHETIQGTIYLKIVDYEENTIYKKTYKTINNIFKYGFKRVPN